MKRKSPQSQAMPVAGTGSSRGGRPPALTATAFPWHRFFFRLVVYGDSSEGCLEIERDGEVVAELGLSPVQATVLHMLVAKLLDASISHRAGRLISTKTFIDELSRRYDDPSGARVWHAQAVHDLIYDVREKLRTSRAARWAVKDTGREFDFGKHVLSYDAAYRKYGLSIPRDRLEILDYSGGG